MIFDEIINYCPVLKEVQFFHRVPSSLEEHFVSFLEKLGKQLVNASLTGISMGSRPRIAEKCPNLRGRCTVSSIGILEDLEEIAEDLHLQQFSGGSALSKNIVRMRYLRSLTIEGFPGTLLFAQPMETLKEMRFDYYMNPREVLNLLKFTLNLAILSADLEKINDVNMFDGVGLLVKHIEKVDLREGLNAPYFGNEERQEFIG